MFEEDQDELYEQRFGLSDSKKSRFNCDELSFHGNTVNGKSIVTLTVVPSFTLIRRGSFLYLKLNLFNVLFIQSRTLTFQKICFICFNKSSLKITKNVFYFICFLVMQKKHLDQKEKLNFKVYDVTTWLKNITIRCCPKSHGGKTNRQ